jgi:SAM-dependent methyltransferase
MSLPTVKQTYLQSSRLPPPTLAQMIGLTLAGSLLVPVYWVLARFRGLPGLQVRWKCLRLGLRLLVRRQAPIDLKTIILLILYPLDSTRYFELDFVWQALNAGAPGRYLDVSSPRLLFTLLLPEHKTLQADLLNPDKADLAETRKLLQAAGLLARCRLHDCVIAQAPLASASFDVITSVSVVEHIPEDRQAIQKIWGLLKPGGRFILTVPCAAQTSEQYIDRDEYGLHGGGKDGRVFWQRFYDAALLSERIYSVTGQPRRQQIYGERAPGLFLKMATRKRTDRYYPFWREPYMTSREYTWFESVEDLPGEGVIAMEFVKP